MIPATHRFLLIFLLVCLVGCVAGPVEVARQYERGLRESRVDRVAELTFHEGAPLTESLAQAIAEGRLGELSASESWESPRATARVEVEDHFYLLTRHAGRWKVRCASVGPYHTQTPEMAMLLVLHTITAGDFEAFKSLVSSEFTLSDGPVPADFQETLLQWAGWLSDARCRPFARSGNRAELVYHAEGMRKRVVFVLERDGWKVSSLW